MQYKATLPLPELRRALQVRVNDKRASLIAGGMTFAGHRYDTDRASIENITSTVAAIGAGIPLPVGFVWRSADNESVPHDAASITELAGALLAFVNGCYAHSFALKDAIEASENPSFIDIQSGWPS